MSEWAEKLAKADRVADYKVDMMGIEDEVMSRIATVYDDLVGLTEVPAKSERQSYTLSLLLALMEYLRCKSDDDPIPGLHHGKEYSPQLLTVTIEGAALDYLKALREGLPVLTDTEIVTAALNVLTTRLKIDAKRKENER